MLMKDDKKMGGTVHVSQSDATVPQDEADYIVEEIMSAIEMKDRAALKESLKALINVCMDQYEPGSEE